MSFIHFYLRGSIHQRDFGLQHFLVFLNAVAQRMAAVRAKRLAVLTDACKQQQGDGADSLRAAHDDCHAT